MLGKLWRAGGACSEAPHGTMGRVEINEEGFYFNGTQYMYSIIIIIPHAYALEVPAGMTEMLESIMRQQNRSTVTMQKLLVIKRPLAGYLGILLDAWPMSRSASV
jgi:hypothetical protein